MKTIRGIQVLALACLGTAACGGAVRSAPTLGPVPIESRIFRDNAGGIRYTAERVIRDATSWTEVWKEATSAQATPPSLPEVNFERNMLLMVAAGRMTVMDAIRVDSVGSREELTEAGRRQEVLAVYYTLVRGCPPSRREAYPVEIVRVRRSTSDVRFIARSESGPGCQ
jgi:hypothetical protein